ncbi:hypothetical protein EON67_02980 [archaeon]|nr:MAG: hypothetical protein EON67_02980 [archaeon]
MNVRCGCGRTCGRGAELTKSFTKGYALVDILTEVSRSLATIQLPADARTILLEKLADIEYVRARARALVRR